MTEHKIGEIYVDAGLCWLGDPCYIMGNDASSRVKDWSEFCENLHRGEPQHSTPLGHGTGIAVSTGYGDGCYPVLVTYDEETGRVASVRVVFIGQRNAEEEEAESEGDGGCEID